MQDYRRLRVWHAAHQMSVNTTNSFPERAGSRAPGLRAQILRAAQSVPANIAEGCARSSRADLARYVEIAIGSANELEGHLLYARDTYQLSEAGHDRLAPTVVVVRKMLVALLQKLQHEIAIEMDRKRAERTERSAPALPPTAPYLPAPPPM
jgi:four helix bundle protein